MEVTRWGVVTKLTAAAISLFLTYRGEGATLVTTIGSSGAIIHAGLPSAYGTVTAATSSVSSAVTYSGGTFSASGGAGAPAAGHAHPYQLGIGPYSLTGLSGPGGPANAHHSHSISGGTGQSFSENRNAFFTDHSVFYAQQSVVTQSSLGHVHGIAPLSFSTTTSFHLNDNLFNSIEVPAGYALNLDGGQLRGLGMTRNGAFNHHDGTLTISGGTYAQPADTFTLNGDVPDADPVLVLENGATTSGITTARIGLTHRGELLVRSGSALTTNGSAVIGSESTAIGMATITGADSLLASGNNLYIGADGDGTLHIREGASVTNDAASIGWQSTADGHVVVADAGSSWVNDDNLSVGGAGGGLLTIDQGGAVSNRDAYIGELPGSTGRVFVFGAGSKWTSSTRLAIGGNSAVSGGIGLLQVADRGEVVVGGALKIWTNGMLTIDGGSLAASSLDRSLGTFNHHDGTVIVSGGLYSQAPTTFSLSGDSPDAQPQMILENGATTSGITGARIGDIHDGELVVRSGSTFSTAGNAAIGNESTSAGKATVTGAGSLLAIGNNMSIGGHGNGILNIESGASVTNDQAWIGAQPNSRGEVFMTGAGSSWVNDDKLSIGAAGEGVLAILNGSSVSNISAYIGELPGSTGHVTVSGQDSTWTTVGALKISQGGRGSLGMVNGAVVSATEGIDIGSNGRLQGDGTIRGDLVNAGRIIPGNTTETLFIDGEFAQSAGGSLEINLTSPAHFNRLAVTGLATLGGAIEVLHGPAFSPKAGDGFEILTSAGGIVGDFSNYVLPQLPGALIWNSLITANSVTLAIATPLAADFNGDGFIDAEDLAAWTTDFGATNAPVADGDFDGDSDGNDFLKWQRQLHSARDAPGAIPVPEPTSLVVMLCLIAEHLSSRRTRWSPGGT